MDAEDRSPQLAGVLAFMFALSTVAVIPRVYCRGLIVKSVHLDDYAALLGYILFAVHTGFASAGLVYGTGQHAWNIKPASNLPIAVKWWWACESAYVLANMAIKFSIAITLIRIATSTAHHVVLWMTIVVMELYSAAFCLLFLLQCQPASYFWTRFTGGKGSCIDPNIMVNTTYGYSAVSCATDWILAILPVLILWDLDMNPRTKISVVAILSMGAIASIATIIRIPFITGMRDSADFLYDTTYVAIWSTTETGLGITAACLATLTPLFVRLSDCRRMLVTGSNFLDPDASSRKESGLEEPERPRDRRDGYA